MQKDGTENTAEPPRILTTLAPLLDYMAKYSYGKMWHSQRGKQPPVQRADLSGLTVVVTGANVGIGFEAAKHFARMRPECLVLACRSRQKGEAAIAELQKETGYTRAELMILDMSTFATVARFSDEFERTHARLDILVCNAGISNLDYERYPDGYESMIQVNYLSTAQLALRMLPLMVKTGQDHRTFPRLTIVSSDMHLVTKIAPSVLQNQQGVLTTLSDPAYCKKRGVMFDRYNLSKLLTVFLARELTNGLPSASPVVVNMVDPGFCKSSLQRNNGPVLALLGRAFEGVLAKTAEEGARMLIWGALLGRDDPALRAQVRGAYTARFEIAEVSDWVLSREGADAQSRVWRETLQVLEAADPQVKVVSAQLLTGGGA